VKEEGKAANKYNVVLKSCIKNNAY